MAEDQSEQRTCDLSLVLFRYGGVHTWYDAKGGLKRKFVLSGRIDDPYRSPLEDIYEFGEGNSAFHNKPVRVEISASSDPKWLGDVIARLGDDRTFGVVWVKAHVEPKRFELDCEMVEVEPITLNVEMNIDAFEAVRRQAVEADDHRRIMWAKVALVGETLPEPNNKLGFIDLKNLDISKDTEYAIGGFEIFDTRYTDHLRGRVLQIDRGRDEAYGAHVSILLTGARYEIDAERALLYSISCEGRVFGEPYGKGKPYDGVDVTVEFAEHEPNRYNELPERAFFGEFGYYPKRPEEQYSSNHFAFNLRYLSLDARSLLIPLLSQVAETQIILKVNLTNEESELLAATDKIRGNVRHYSFEVRRRLVDYSTILKQLEEARERLVQHTLDDGGRFSSEKGVSEERFQSIRRSLVAGGRVPDIERFSLSFEQIDTLADEFGR